LDAHFTRSFYKHILGLPVNYHDLEAIEPEYYKSLKQLLEWPLEELGLDLTFSVESNDFGQLRVVDLIPDGQNIPVTDENKSQYIQLIAQNRTTTAIRAQIDQFLEGFHELVPPELISIFDAQELELLISGLPYIDIDDLRANTEYHNYREQVNYSLTYSLTHLLTYSLPFLVG
jgi:E3 ubiquitin-protein ligase HUWE1